MTRLQEARHNLVERLSELALSDEAHEIAEAIEKMIEAKMEKQPKGVEDK